MRTRVWPRSPALSPSTYAGQSQPAGLHRTFPPTWPKPPGVRGRQGPQASRPARQAHPARFSGGAAWCPSPARPGPAAGTPHTSHVGQSPGGPRTMAAGTRSQAGSPTDPAGLLRAARLAHGCAPPSDPARGKARERDHAGSRRRAARLRPPGICTAFSAGVEGAGLWFRPRG
jgi:hypothetical protein